MILEVKDLAFGYPGGETLFQHVSFALEEGQIFSILGANGAGKSTMMNCIANLLTPNQGEIRIAGKRLSDMSIREVSTLIGYVPQMHTAAYGYAVRDFVVMGRAPHLGFLKQPCEVDFALVDDTLEELGITKLANRPYTELSGGERQQVSIARAIVQQPKIIMLDEPTNHLDYGNQLRMLNLVRKLSAKGYTIIITSHMPDHVLLLGGSVGMLNDDGSFVTGKNDEIITEENLRRLYGVDVHLVYVEPLHRVACVSGE